MSAIHQATLPLPRPDLPRVRACRRPFVPSPPTGPYRLPPAVLDRLTATLAPFRNREAALTFAVFLGRYHSAPRKLLEPFPIDRRAIAERSAIELTEAQVRGAIRTLEAVGFLDRADDRRRFQVTADGLHRRPILFTFGQETRQAFDRANRMALAAAQQAAGGRRAPAGTKDTAQASRPSYGPLTGLRPSYPKDTSSSEARVIMGERSNGSAGQRPAAPIEPGSALERALADLAAGVLGNRGRG